MNLETKEKAVQDTVVGATDEQLISKNVSQIIAEDLARDNMKPAETSAVKEKVAGSSVSDLEMLSMSELYDSSFAPRLPVVITKGNSAWEGIASELIEAVPKLVGLSQDSLASLARRARSAMPTYYFSSPCASSRSILTQSELAPD